MVVANFSGYPSKTDVVLLTGRGPFALRPGADAMGETLGAQQIW
jgi:hypothetical protein